MGRLLALTAVVLGLSVLVASPAQAQKSSKSTIVVEPEMLDMGNVEAGTTVTAEVKLRNKGRSPITFTRVNTSCSCITGAVDGKEVRRGDSATVVVTLEVPEVNGPSVKTLYAFYEQGKPPVNIPVKFDVIGAEPLPDGNAPGDQPRVPNQPRALDVTMEIDGNADPSAEVAFGYLLPDSTTERRVLLRNNGDEPVEFTRVSTGCSCATGEVEKRPIEPGDAAELIVTFKANANPGVQNRNISVWAKGVPRPFDVKVTAEVTHQLRADPFFINMLKDQKGKVLIESVDERPFKVLSVDGKKPVFEKGHGKSSATSHIIIWNMENVKEDDVPPFLIIETDHPEVPILDLRVIHMGIIKNAQGEETPSWILGTDRVLLGAMSPGDAVTRTFKLVKLSNIDDVKVESPDDAFEVKIVEVKPVARALEATVEFRPKTKANGTWRSGVVMSEIVFHARGEEQSCLVFAKALD